MQLKNLPAAADIGFMPRNPKRNPLLQVSVLLAALAGGPMAAADATAVGGAACVMAKWQGNTLDYVLVTGSAGPEQAQQAARDQLKAKGYGNYGAGVDVTHPQGFTNLPHAFVVVLRSDYKTWRGKDRTSYGCGFSAVSRDEALWDAIRDMQRFSWGWIPDRDGYQLVEEQRY